MNILVLIAGIMTASIVTGHFAFGIPWYLKPMLGASFKKVPKATMQAVFHYVSVFLLLSAIFLILVGTGKLPLEENAMLVKFIGINFLLFSLVQLHYAFRNKIEKPLTTMFQWSAFLPIAILCLI